MRIPRAGGGEKKKLFFVFLGSIVFYNIFLVLPDKTPNINDQTAESIPGSFPCATGLQAFAAPLGLCKSRSSFSVKNFISKIRVKNQFLK